MPIAEGISRRSLNPNMYKINMARFMWRNGISGTSAIFLLVLFDICRKSTLCCYMLPLHHHHHQNHYHRIPAIFTFLPIFLFWLKNCYYYYCQETDTGSLITSLFYEAFFGIHLSTVPPPPPRCGTLHQNNCMVAYAKMMYEDKNIEP